MNLAKNLKDKENLIMYIDLHGHSIKRNVFAYGPKFDQNLVILYKISPNITNVEFYLK